MVGIGPSGSGRRDMQERRSARRLHICFPERGHQTGVYVLPHDRPTPPSYQDAPVVSEYFRQCEEVRRQRRGEWGRVTGSPGEIFPNTALHPRQPRTIAVWHPRGPHQTEVWRWYLVDQDAPLEVRDFLRQYYIRYSGPGGLTEQDDMENWNYAHAASRGTIARRYPYSYEQGMGFEVHDFTWEGLHLPGVVMDITEAKSSEHNLRNLYRRWAEFMEATSWDALATWRSGTCCKQERPGHQRLRPGKGEDALRRRSRAKGLTARNRAIPTTRFPRRHSRASRSAGGAPCWSAWASSTRWRSSSPGPVGPCSACMRG